MVEVAVRSGVMEELGDVARLIRSGRIGEALARLTAIEAEAAGDGVLLQAGGRSPLLSTGGDADAGRSRLSL